MNLCQLHLLDVLSVTERRVFMFFTLHMNNILVTAFYSFKDLIVKNKNESFINKFTSIDLRKLDLYFKIVLDFDFLALQADTFARNYSSHGHINFFKVLRCRNDDVVQYLFEMFVYSFVKCLHNGWFYHNLSEDSNMGYCFIGHSKFFNVLKGASLQRRENDVSINIMIENDSITRRRMLVALLVRQFPFLTSYSDFSDNFGLQPFLIPELEDRFAYLLYDYYSSRATEELKDVKTPKSRNILDEKGMLQIVKCNDAVGKSILKPEAYPIANAFLTEDGSELFYIAVNGKYSIENNPSFFFSKANFIRFVRSSEPTKIRNNYYNVQQIDSSHLFLVCSEVFTNTGIKCSYFETDPNSIQGYDPVRPITTVSKLKQLEEKLQESLTTKEILKIINLFLEGVMNTEGK